MAATGMSYQELLPGNGAQRVAHSFWRFWLESDEPTRSHRIVPDGTTSVSVRVEGGVASALFLTGPTRRAHVAQVHPGTIYAGLRFRPECAGPYLGLRSADLRDRFEPLASDLPQGAALRGALGAFAISGEAQPLETLLARSRISPDLAVGIVAGRLSADGGRSSIPALAAEVGLSERQLRRRFSRATGVTPKEFAGLNRLREACIAAAAGQTSCAVIAAEADYADQAHLSRHVRAAFYETPLRLAAYLRRILHRFPTT